MLHFKKYISVFVILFIQIAYPQPSWQLIDAPDQSRFRSFYKGDDGIYLTGSKIFRLTQDQFNLFTKEIPVNIDRSFILSPTQIWFSNLTNSSESRLFFYNGRKWKELRNPLVNNITTIYFSDENNGYIAGLAEIVKISEGRAEFLPSPTTGTIEEIVPLPDGRIYIRTITGELFQFANDKWIRELRDDIIYDIHLFNDESGYAIAKGKFYNYKNGKWELHSESDLIDQINHFFVLNQDKIWAVGRNGTIIKYFKGIWSQEKSITRENLFNILMISDKEGYICGEHGTLLKYSENKLPEQKKIITFSPIHLYNASKSVDDEYGISINDFNGDGKYDIMAVCIFEPDRLYINYGYIFRDEAQRRNLNPTFFSEFNSNPSLDLGVASGDIDNDSDMDLFITSLNGKNRLFVNDGNGFFRDFSNQAGIEGGEDERTSSALFADFDNDGNLDLFVVNENSTNRLYLNNGAGYFREVTKETGLETVHGSVSAIASDIDSDNDIDIFICNWASYNLLYLNNLESGKLKFTEVGEKSGVRGEIFTKSNGAVIEDFDNDGDPDLYVTNRKHSNQLLLNDGNGIFTDATGQVISKDTMRSYGVVAGDFDHDGYTDIYVNNIGVNKLYLNKSGKHFKEASEIFGVNIEGYSTGSVVSDIDDDGDLDIYVANYIGVSSQLLRNNLNDSNYIKIKFDCTITNKFGLGVKVWLYRIDKAGNKVLSGFKSNNTFSGYASQGPPELHFATIKDYLYELEVLFPVSGTRKIIGNIRGGSRLLVYETDGISYYSSGFNRMLKRIFAESRTYVEVLKVLFIMLMILIWYRSVKKNKERKLHKITFLFIIILNFILLDYFLFDEIFLFSNILPVLTTAILFTGSYFFFERSRAVEEKKNIRSKISRDLHDDLASNLSAASLYTGVLKEIKSDDKKENEIITKLERITTEAQQSLREIVWSVTPQNDYIENLIEMMRSYSQNLLASANIRLIFESDSEIGNYEISHEFRRNTFLILKESLSNIIKHSGAKNVAINIKQNKGKVIFTISDDGIGLAEKEIEINESRDTFSLNGNIVSGNGLRNILSRARDLNANIGIVSKPGQGVTIRLEYK
jgi:signal transduction histidine kinase